jgi:twitching motility protein PilT
MSTIQIDRLLDTAIKQKASDLHLSVGKPPTLRMKGRLIELKTKPLDPADTVALMKQISPERTEIEVQENGGSDFAISWGDTRFRCAIFKQKGTIAIVMRRIPSELLTFEQIGLPKLVRELVRRPRGLFLVTGPTGSGKTTTLASMINYTRQNLERHIITIEDPIEYQFGHDRSIINQREVHTDVPSFAEAIRRALRQDPDVILVGEMRDLETIGSAVSAAETGHLVYGTLHTNSAGGTINRLIDAFPTDQQEQIRAQLSTALIAVLCQQLMPRIEGGMVAAYEFMVVTPAIANLIRENKSFRIDSMIQTGAKFGMRLLDDHIWELYEKGVVDAESAVDKARDPERMAEAIHRAGGKVGRTEWDVLADAASDAPAAAAPAGKK